MSDALATLTDDELIATFRLAAVELRRHLRCGDSRCHRDASRECDRIVDEWLWRHSTNSSE